MNKLIEQKFNFKKFTSEKEGIPFLLSIHEYCLLLQEAKITAEDIEVVKYHLSRYNDEGPYIYGNCRFVFHMVNRQEKKISEKAKAASIRNAIIANKYAAISTKGTVTVKDIYGNNYKVSIYDPRYLSGELQPIWKDKKHSKESIAQMKESAIGK